jgi:hypothetical protein
LVETCRTPDSTLTKTRGGTATSSCSLVPVATGGWLAPAAGEAHLVTGHATAGVDAQAEIAKREPPEAITAPATPSRIRFLILIDLSFFGSDEWSNDEAEDRTTT